MLAGHSHVLSGNKLNSLAFLQKGTNAMLPLCIGRLARTGLEAITLVSIAWRHMQAL